MPPPIVAGYMLVRPVEAPTWLQAVPGKLITISDCIVEDLPRPEYWDWFQDPADAARAQSVMPDTTVVAVALETDEAARLIEEMGGPGQPWFALLRRKVVAQGRLLGYELVGAEPTLDLHSWHCHDYAGSLLASRGIRIDDLGLLPTLADAKAALDWMTSLPSDEAPAPVPWFVVALYAQPVDAPL